LLVVFEFDVFERRANNKKSKFLMRQRKNLRSARGQPVDNQSEKLWQLGLPSSIIRRWQLVGSDVGLNQFDVWS
jgi:hypothetical protein